MDIPARIAAFAEAISQQDTAPVLDAGVIAQLSAGVAGRYDLDAVAGVFDRGVLRLSFDDLYLSFDAFHPPAAQTETYLLGGRRDWAFSFHGPLRIVGHEGNRLTALASCVMATTSGRGEYYERQKATVALEIDVQAGTVLAVDVAVYDNAAGLQKVWHHAAPVRRDAAFRRIGFDLEIDPALTDEFGAVFDLLLGAGDLSLARALAGIGIDAVVGVAQTDLGQRVSELDAAPEPAPVDDAALDWSYVVSFRAEGHVSGRHDHDHGHDHAEDDERPFGISFGLAGPADRFRSRFAAAINVHDIHDDALRHAPDGRGLSEDEKLAWLVRFTCMHEIGHLLNMPHCWERLSAHPMLGPPVPDAMTWLQYPFLYPSGPVRRSVIGNGDGAEDIRAGFARRFHTKFFDHLAQGHPTLTRDEARFVRHAPLNHIAQGGHTFLDHALPPAQITQAKSHAGRSLDIVALRAPSEGGGAVPVASLDAFFFRHPSMAWVQFPRLPFAIQLKDHQFGDFDLLSGKLQLIVKLVDYPARPTETHRDEVRAFAVDLSHDLGRLAGPAVSTFTRRLTVEQPQVFPPDAIALPWLDRGRMTAIFGERHIRDFVLQAVYFHAGAEYRSTPVKVTFGAGGFGDARPETHSGLAVPHDGSLAQFTGQDPRPFEFRTSHLPQITCRAKDPAGTVFTLDLGRATVPFLPSYL